MTPLSYPGFFITLEGIEGTGKSTQIKRIAESLIAAGFPVFVTREPGGPPISEKIRRLLLDPSHAEMTPLTEALLYQASRAQHVQEWILPRLTAGEIVISDRFYDASIAYQGAGRALGIDLVKQLSLIATTGLTPDLTIIIDLPVEIGLARGRYGSKNEFPEGEGDRLERENAAFHRKVRDTYLELAKTDNRFVLINGNQGIDAVFSEIHHQMMPFVRQKFQSTEVS